MKARAITFAAAMLSCGLLPSCIDDVYLAAYPEDEPRQMFVAVHTLRGARGDGHDVLQLVASDQPVDCSAPPSGRFVLELALTDGWRLGDREGFATLVASDPLASRMRWASYRRTDEWGSPSGRVGPDGSLLVVNQQTAPLHRGEVAKFRWLIIRVATLPPVDTGSPCDVGHNVEGWPEGQDCPLPTRVERLYLGPDAVLCDDIDPSTL